MNVRNQNNVNVNGEQDLNVNIDCKLYTKINVSMNVIISYNKKEKMKCMLSNEYLVIGFC